jgi:hypothetical protein
MTPSNTIRLNGERLEDRSVPTLFGNPWPDPGRLSFSFAPDGTDVAGVQSRLGTTLGGLGVEVWQREVSRAFQTWAAVANLNFTAVPDNGKEFGEPGPVQGSEWFGDIRVAARPLSDNELAVANPFNMFSNWAGEIVLNSNKPFSVGAAPGRYDLYTVMLQEVGHALGLDNSPDAGTAMFTTYSGARTGLAAGDVAAVQRLYGGRTPDRFDATGTTNDTLNTADPIAFVTDADKQLGTTDGTAGGKPFVAAGDLTTLSDVDYYVYTTPKGSDDFTVSVLTSGLSQLNARVSVYDSAGRLLKAAVATPPGQGKPFELFVGNTRANSTYRIKVEAASQDVFGVGQYKLAVGNQSQEAVVKRVEATFDTASGKKDGDDHDDTYQPSALLSYVDLGIARPKGDARWDYTGYADVYQPGDSDVFKVRTTADTPPVLVISAWDTFGGEFDPTVRVYDSAGRKVAYEVLQDDRGTFTIQVVGVKPNTDYYIRVYAENPADSNTNTGKYFLGIDFRPDAITHTTFAAGTLQGGTNQVFTSFALTRTQALWFELSGAVNPDVASRLTVYDANGVGVFTLRSEGGRVAGGGVFLTPGTYTVRIVAAARSGVLPAYTFRARYSLESDPIGPEPITDPAPVGSPSPTPTTPILYAPDPTAGTATPLPGVSGVYTSPVGVTVNTSPIIWIADPFVLLFLGTFGDIYSDPWRW